MDYVRPFASSGKTIYKIGINFSSETKTHDRWVIK